MYLYYYIYIYIESENGISLKCRFSWFDASQVILQVRRWGGGGGGGGVRY